MAGDAFVLDGQDLSVKARQDQEKARQEALRAKQDQEKGKQDTKGKEKEKEKDVKGKEKEREKDGILKPTIAPAKGKEAAKPKEVATPPPKNVKTDKKNL